MRADINNWSVCVVEDEDGHLNLYVMNVDSNDLHDDSGQHGDELHYRITTKEIEEAYHEATK